MNIFFAFSAGLALGSLFTGNALATDERGPNKLARTFSYYQMLETTVAAIPDHPDAHPRISN
jgi:hypothetical protein